MGEASHVPFDGENRSSMSNLLEEGKYSDFTITCGKDTYAVHKAIICPRSPFFAACCDGEFKEAKSGVIDLPEDDPAAVKMMIRYLYTGAYTPPSRRPTVVVDMVDRGTHLEQWELHSEEYGAKEKERLESLGFVFHGNRILKRILERPHPPQDFAAPPAASSPAASSPAASSSSAQNQQFGNGNPRGRGNSRNRRGGRNRGNQRGNHTSNSSRSPAPATPAPAPVASTPARSRPPRELEPNFTLHAKVYALGEKYEIQDLKVLALQKFAYEAIFFAHAHEFRCGIQEAYTSTVDEDRELRDVVVDTVLKNRYLIRDRRFQALVKSTELGFDLLLKLM